MSAQRKPAQKSTSAARTRAYRERMRAKGLKPVTIWTFDTTDPDFLRRVREASIAASHDPEERAVMDEVEAFQADLGPLD
ncbi:MAG TPA: antitoxin MazE-like protein [Caulobacteraceae bacterium]